MKSGEDYIGVGCGALIVNDQGEILLLKRKSRNDIDSWCKPGGAVELNETSEAAVIREVKEELGVDIVITSFLGFMEHFPVSEEGKKQHWVASNFLAKIISGEPKNMEPEKCEEVRWFPISNLPENLTETTRVPLEIYLKEKRPT